MSLNDTKTYNAAIQPAEDYGHGESETIDYEKRDDVVAKYANYFTGDDTYSAAEWHKLRWKLDLRLVPLLWFNYTLGAIDKVTTGTAALYGLIDDTNLTGNRYSWVGSAFYVSISKEVSPLLLRSPR